MVGASLSSVKRWKAAWKKGGVEAVAAKPHPGRKPKLTNAQKRQLERMLLRGPRGGLFQRPVDVRPSRRSDPSPVRGDLPRRSCAANPAGVRLVLPEAGTAGPRARRSGHRTVANAEVAADKKRAFSEKLASFSRTKAASCCSRCVVGPGHAAAKRQSCVLGIVAIACRRSPRSRSLRGGDGCRSTSVGKRPTSTPRTWSPSYANCITVSERRLRSSGIVAAHIARLRVSSWLTNRSGCGSSGCLPTLRNSIPPSRFGTQPRTSTWSTPRLTTSQV